MLAWFLALDALGIRGISRDGGRGILAAFDPLQASIFRQDCGLHGTLAALSMGLLAITGCEALYADMGHFGRKSIRISRYLVPFPALILIYLGQGAWMLSGGEIHQNNVFFSMVPSWALIPMVVLATAATVIASQALITGPFSVTRQAIALGLFPRLRIAHTSD